MTHSSHRSHAHKSEQPKSMQPPDEERIRIRAYELYQSRDGGAGDPVSDWYQAVAELSGVTKQKSK